MATKTLEARLERLSVKEEHESVQNGGAYQKSKVVILPTPHIWWTLLMILTEHIVNSHAPYECRTI